MNGSRNGGGCIGGWVLCMDAVGDPTTVLGYRLLESEKAMHMRNV